MKTFEPEIKALPTWNSDYRQVQNDSKNTTTIDTS